LSSSVQNNLASRPVPGLGVCFQRVEKRYGAVRALRGLSLSIAAGEFVALLGANGSGKSTLLRIAASLTRPTAGQVEIRGARGQPAGDPAALRGSIGMVAHATFLYDDLTAEENLFLFCRLYGLDRPAARVTERLRVAGLLDRRCDLVRTFSRGMRQRLALARALLHGPSLLLLDEPSTGLDRDGFAWLREELRALHTAGCTIMMATHQQSEAVEMSTRAVWLAAGELVRDTSVAALSPALAAEGKS
jgi:heme exporter protein A